MVELTATPTEGRSFVLVFPSAHWHMEIKKHNDDQTSTHSYPADADLALPTAFQRLSCSACLPRMGEYGGTSTSTISGNPRTAMGMNNRRNNNNPRHRLHGIINHSCMMNIRQAIQDS